jgi:ribosomal protein S18 acetylase RimI-like enzyme
VAAAEATIRAATLADAPLIARVHVDCWREAYDGLLPADALAALSVPQRTMMWQRILGEAPSPIRAYVGERQGEMVALASCGKQRDADLEQKGFDGEIGAIYVLKSSQKHGIGTALMRTMASALAGLGFSGLSLWVLRENVVARRFYEMLGGKVIGEKTENRPFGTIVEVTYGWSDLALLRGRDDR